MIKRSPNLTPQRIGTIIDIIHSWEGRLTWPALIKTVAGTMHSTYTRQALFKQERIRVAYDAYRASNTDSAGGRPVPAAIKASLERIKRLELENAELKMREALLMEQFVRWAYNASTRGLSENFLNMALPPTNRHGNEISRTRR